MIGKQSRATLLAGPSVVQGIELSQTRWEVLAATSSFRPTSAIDVSICLCKCLVSNDSRWTKYLPKGSYNQAAGLLTSFGILEKVKDSGAEGLASSIETLIKTPFQSVVLIQSSALTPDWTNGVAYIARECCIHYLCRCSIDLSLAREKTPKLQRPKSTADTCSRKRQIQIEPIQRPQNATARSCPEIFTEEQQNNVPRFPDDVSVILYSPSPPQSLSTAQSCLFDVKTYFQSTCEEMRFNDDGTLLDPSGAELRNDLCNEFDSYCFNATMLESKNSEAEFSHALSKAYALVQRILQAEHPRTLACFLEVLIHLIQSGLPGVASDLRNLIKRRSQQVTSGMRPWGRICRLLGNLDADSLEEAMAQIWKCMSDIFGDKLGVTSRLAVSVRLDYIKRVYGFNQHYEEERLLRDLLTNLGRIPESSTPRVMLNLAHNLNRQSCYEEAQKMASDVCSLLGRKKIYADRVTEKTEVTKTIAFSLFSQGKTIAAEWSILEAIRMVRDLWGIDHPWVIEFKQVLEGWFRGWDREEDADKLRKEIEESLATNQNDE